MLDRISSAGFLSFGDVRDAIARGQMKLPDLSGPNEYVRGDPLLRLDRRLATQLDGVYRRAESYTRGLERLTAFNFGTRTGRWLTRNVSLPFGAAFLVAQFVWLLVSRANAKKDGVLNCQFFDGMERRVAVPRRLGRAGGVSDLRHPVGRGPGRR